MLGKKLGESTADTAEETWQARQKGFDEWSNGFRKSLTDVVRDAANRTGKAA